MLFRLEDILHSHHADKAKSLPPFYPSSLAHRHQLLAHTSGKPSINLLPKIPQENYRKRMSSPAPENDIRILQTIAGVLAVAGALAIVWKSHLPW
ncbi:hypothetical protein SLA2020_400390 [Shorea laevis]